jgi:cytochrome c oxidase cbb3-type subunit 3
VTSSVHPASEAHTQEDRVVVHQTARVLDHEYDGIREYDNPMPGWWVAIFWATFLFSVGYLAHYHFTGRGESIAAAYEDEMRVAREERAKRSLGEAPSEASLAQLMADPALMQDANALFAQRCAACHAAEGQGLIGPNLTDAHWIHGGGKLMDIYQVVSAGVPAKGMPAWELQLQPIEVRKLVAFVGTMRGKNLPGKAAEGKLVSSP